MLTKYLFAAVYCFHLAIVSQAQNFTSSNLPIVIINTGGQIIPDNPKITADMGIIFNGVGIRNNFTDPYNQYNGKIGIEVRGKSSQSFPMKSYSVELRDVAGASVNKSILGMPAESDWVLYAPYTDKTLMHNFLAYTISNELGHWAAHCRYVEVVMNNNYVGVYVLLEKIKRGASRVDIPKLKTTDITGDALTGGYIFKIDKEDPGDDGWYSQYTPNNPSGTQIIKFLYEYPKAADIVTEQKNYIKAYVDSFENALKSTTYQDTITGYRKYADLNSFVDCFIVNEVSRNVDGYRLSSFFYKDKKSKGGKIIAGPVWDYDLAFRNANYCNGSNIDGWSYKFNTVCNGDYWLVPFWWDRMIQDSNFEAALHCRWKQLRQTTLSNDHLNFLIDSINTLLGEAQPRHFQRWPILGQYIWPNPQPIPATFAGELSTLKQWLSDRLKWIDDNLPNKGGCMDWPAGLNSSMNIKLYPSPFKSNIHLWIQTKTSQELTLQVSNATGQVVLVKTISAAAGISSITDFSTDNWGEGLYDFYILNKEGEKLLKRVIRL